MARKTKEGLYQRQDRAEWYCRIYAPSGALVRCSTGETHYDKAFKVYNRRRIELGCQPDDSQGVTVNTVLDTYHQHRGHALAGQHGYTQGKAAILKYYDGVTWETLAAPCGDKSLDEYIEHRTKVCGCKPGTVNREIGILSAAANMAIRKGLEITNPCHRRKLPTTKHPYYWLTHEDAAELIAACQPRDGFKNSEHLLDWCLIALGTGMRMSEILKLRAADISLRHNTIRLPTSKSGEPHEIPMTPGVLAVVKSRLQRAAELQTPYLFANPKTRQPVKTIITPFKHACQRAGIPITDKKTGQVGFRVHDTRHTVGSWLVQAGEPLEKVQDLLNHSDIRTTQRYAHHAPEARKATVAKLPEL